MSEAGQSRQGADPPSRSRQIAFARQLAEPPPLIIRRPDGGTDRQPATMTCHQRQLRPMTLTDTDRHCVLLDSVQSPANRTEEALQQPIDSERFKKPGR